MTEILRSWDSSGSVPIKRDNAVYPAIKGTDPLLLYETGAFDQARSAFAEAARYEQAR